MVTMRSLIVLSLLLALSAALTIGAKKHHTHSGHSKSATKAKAASLEEDGIKELFRKCRAGTCFETKKEKETRRIRELKEAQEEKERQLAAQRQRAKDEEKRKKEQELKTFLDALASLNRNADLATELYNFLRLQVSLEPPKPQRSLADPQFIVVGGAEIQKHILNRYFPLCAGLTVDTFHHAPGVAQKTKHVRNLLNIGRRNGLESKSTEYINRCLDNEAALHGVTETMHSSKMIQAPEFGGVYDKKWRKAASEAQGNLGVCISMLMGPEYPKVQPGRGYSAYILKHHQLLTGVSPARSSRRLSRRSISRRRY
jgi:hypothetical protein